MTTVPRRTAPARPLAGTLLLTFPARLGRDELPAPNTCPDPEVTDDTPNAASHCRLVACAGRACFGRRLPAVARAGPGQRLEGNRPAQDLASERAEAALDLRRRWHWLLRAGCRRRSTLHFGRPR